jgi:hypothetical protein
VRAILVGLAVTAALLAVPAASAKEFGPGDLRLCGAARCVPIVNREVLPRLSSFYYSDDPLAPVRRPALGAPYFQLRFSNGYVTGIVATSRLDRFLSYGVHVGRFAPGQWYAFPRRLAAELRRLSASLRPLGLTRAALARSR